MSPITIKSSYSTVATVEVRGTPLAVDTEAERWSSRYSILLFESRMRYYSCQPDTVRTDSSSNNAVAAGPEEYSRWKAALVRDQGLGTNVQVAG